MWSLKKELLIVFMKNKSGGGQKGVAVYLSLMITSILLAIGLGLTVIIISQVVLMRNIGDSVVALYAADTGTEHALYNKRIEKESGEFPGEQPLGPAGYTVRYVYSEPEGYWKSIGTFKGSKRSIEVGVFAIPPEELRDYWLGCLGDCGEPNDNCPGYIWCPQEGEGEKDNSYLKDDLCQNGCSQQTNIDPETGAEYYVCRMPDPEPCTYLCDEGYIFDDLTQECIEG